MCSAARTGRCCQQRGFLFILLHSCTPVWQQRPTAHMTALFPVLQCDATGVAPSNLIDLAKRALALTVHQLALYRKVGACPNCGLCSALFAWDKSLCLCLPAAPTWPDGAMWGLGELAVPLTGRGMAVPRSRPGWMVRVACAQMLPAPAAGASSSSLLSIQRETLHVATLHATLHAAAGEFAAARCMS